MARAILAIWWLCAIANIKHSLTQVPIQSGNGNTNVLENGGAISSADAWLNGLLGEIIPQIPNEMNSNQVFPDTTRNSPSVISDLVSINSTSATDHNSNTTTNPITQDRVPFADKQGSTTNIDTQRFDQLGRTPENSLTGNLDPLSESIDPVNAENINFGQPADHLFLTGNAIEPNLDPAHPMANLFIDSTVPSPKQDNMTADNPAEITLPGSATQKENIRSNPQTQTQRQDQTFSTTTISSIQIPIAESGTLRKSKYGTNFQPASQQNAVSVNPVDKLFNGNAPSLDMHSRSYLNTDSLLNFLLKNRLGNKNSGTHTQFSQLYTDNALGSSQGLGQLNQGSYIDAHSNSNQINNNINNIDNGGQDYFGNSQSGYQNKVQQIDGVYRSIRDLLSMNGHSKAGKRLTSYPMNQSFSPQSNLQTLSSLLGQFAYLMNQPEESRRWYRLKRRRHNSRFGLRHFGFDD